MNPQIRNLVVMFAIMSWSKNLDATDGQTVLIARSAYGAYVLLLLLLNYVMRQRVAAARDGRVISVPKKPSMSNPTPSAGDAERTTVMQYDLSLLNASRSQVLSQGAILALLHWKTGTLAPLVMQSVMGLMRLLDDPIMKIHLLGTPAEGALQRPFKAEPNPLAQLLGGGGGAQRQQQQAASSGTEGGNDNAAASAGAAAQQRAAGASEQLDDVTDSSGDEAAAVDDEDEEEEDEADNTESNGTGAESAAVETTTNASAAGKQTLKRRTAASSSSSSSS